VDLLEVPAAEFEKTIFLKMADLARADIDIVFHHRAASHRCTSAASRSMGVSRTRPLGYSQQTCVG